MDNFLDLRVSYGALERVLLKLDFSLTVTEQHRLYFYKDGEKESVFGFALNISLGQKVRPAHLSSARHAVVAMGVADQATLERLLAEQAPAEQALTSAKAATRTAPKRRSRQPSIPSPAFPAEAH